MFCSQKMSAESDMKCKGEMCWHKANFNVANHNGSSSVDSLDFERHKRSEVSFPVAVHWQKHTIILASTSRLMII